MVLPSLGEIVCYTIVDHPEGILRMPAIVKKILNPSLGIVVLDVFVDSSYGYDHSPVEVGPIPYSKAPRDRTWCYWKDCS